MVQAERDEADDHDGDAHAGISQRVVEEADLQDERRVLEELDVHARDGLQGALAGGRHQADGKADDHGDDEADRGALERIEQAVEERRPVLPDRRPGLRAENRIHDLRLIS